MENDNKIYEIGYLLSPFISEDKLDGEVFNVRKAIEDSRGFIVSEGYPKRQKLAYIIQRPGKEKFFDAYFGWVKFMAESESVLDMKNILDKNSGLIRFLIIKTVKESAVLPRAKRVLKKPAVSETGEVKTEAVSEKEIDEKLDELLGV